jgi:hypothetical protein
MLFDFPKLAAGKASGAPDPAEDREFSDDRTKKPCLASFLASARSQTIATMP